MKVKHRSTCETCRKRKVGCDGKRPGCSQCVLTGRKCDGYQSSWTFVPQNGHVGKQQQQHPAPGRPNNRTANDKDARLAMARRRSRALSSSSSSAWEIHPYGTGSASVPLLGLGLSPCGDDLLSLIVRSYIPENELPYISNGSDNKRSRICGSWVEVLPRLRTQTAHSCILAAATKALAGAILSQNPQQTGATVACTQSYNAAIHALRKGFSLTDYPFHAEFTAAIMCLTLVEIMFPDSAVGVAAHIRGVEQLFHAHGAEKYSSGVLHKLFVGFRPLLVIQAFQTRKATLLATEPWTSVPFSVFSPSPMQSLLSEVIEIPSFLHYMDTLMASPGRENAAKMPFLIEAFTDMLTRLDKWELSLRNETKTPCYWRVPSHTPTSAEENDPDTFLWYPNVTFANVYTYLWTFYIVCLTELAKISEMYPHLPVEKFSQWNGFHRGCIMQQTTALAEQIASSMEYLLQDEMKLFGPASTFLPLQTAYRVFRMEGSSQSKNVDRIRRIVERLVDKGLRSAPIVVFGSDQVQVPASVPTSSAATSVAASARATPTPVETREEVLV